ncbi:ABC transporter substrate-binding protein [Ectopseudomonas composti]|uniref:ABC transporter substrate-binding protein n=1 Tax=Ectopseudomonas composti TaxID=658457 RepID=A0ABN0SI32_9GAMM|nr:transporter substrate-binding domain-containing protein [Pseudomonas composti]EZH84339.1 ABC transporter substrate-binding protein [Pseudomonas composti]
MRAWLLILLLLAPLCRADEVAPLRVMTDLWPPFRMLKEDGQLQGLDIDLLNELSRRTGMRFDVQRAPWARGLAALEQGTADMMTGLAKTPERERYIRYLDAPYYACSPRFYASPALALRLNDYASLRGLRIGYVLESVYFQPFDNDKALDKVGVSNEQQLLEMLARGRIDALVGTDCQVDYSLLEPKLAGRIVKAAYQPEARTELYIGFSRKRLERMPELAAALDTLQREGWIANAALRYQPVVAHQ